MIIEKLNQLEQESMVRKIPIIGKSKGSWLYNKVVKTKPKKILELGTANGYSGIILGSQGAKLITIEQNPEIAKEAQENFKKFKIDAEILIGDGVEIIKSLTNKFDLIFIDFSKSNYIQILEQCIKLTNKDGLIIADNITMQNCQDYKQAVLNHKLLQTEIINIKDGLSCSIKR